VKKRKINSFLVINPFGIGDVLFSTPLIRLLKEKYPDALVYYLCNKKTAPVIRTNPCIADVFVYERSEFAAEQKASWWKGFVKYWNFIASIRSKRIDACIDLSLNTPFGFFALAAGIKLRYGLNFKNRGIFLNRKLALAGFSGKHVAEHYLDVLKLLEIEPRSLRMEVYPSPQSAQWADEFTSGLKIPAGVPVIGIAPCGGDAFGKDAFIKRWPGDSFSSLINKLAAELKAVIFIFAGPAEKADVAVIINGIRDKANVFDLSSLSLEQTIAMTAKCGLFISNDTGPLRFADAMGKKLIALFGPVDEKVYGPYPFDAGRAVVLKKDLPCRPCYRGFRLKQCVSDKKCLRDISVDEVMNAVRVLLKRKDK